jgi:hypothetical protein
LKFKTFDMKRTLLLMLLLPGLVKSQISSIPPKANQIIIQGVGFTELCTRLLDAGYQIEKRDTELQTVKTEPKIYPKSWNAAYKISARIKDSTAILSVTYTAPWNKSLLGTNSDPLWKDDQSYHHTNKKGVTYPKSLMGMPFMLTNEFALSFGKPIEYKIQ